MYEATARKPAGYIRIDDPEAPGGKVEHDTLQCVHCGMHWMVVRGSGRRRGWCTKCNGPCCGKDKCWTCLPEEVLIYGE